VIDAAGGSANLWGSSSGAALAMLATASGAPVTKLALWEPPFILDENARPPKDQVEQYERMVAEDRRGDAAEYFMTKVVGMPPEFVADARTARPPKRLPTCFRTARSGSSTGRGTTWTRRSWRRR
jgi:alpha-beta hydrolase superfamily lysophospholipase